MKKSPYITRKFDADLCRIFFSDLKRSGVGPHYEKLWEKCGADYVADYNGGCIARKLAEQGVMHLGRKVSEDDISKAARWMGYCRKVFPTSLPTRKSVHVVTPPPVTAHSEIESKLEEAEQIMTSNLPTAMKLKFLNQVTK